MKQYSKLCLLLGWSSSTLPGGKETPALSLVGPPGSRTPQSSRGQWGHRCLNGLVTADKADAWGTESTLVLQPPTENSHRLPAPDQHVNSIPIKLF